MPVPTFPLDFPPVDEPPIIGLSSDLPAHMEERLSAVYAAVNALPSHFGLVNLPGALQLQIAGGALPSGAWQVAQEIDLAPTANNYVELDTTTGAVQLGAGAFTGGIYAPLFFAKTDGSSVLNLDGTDAALDLATSIFDRRGWAGGSLNDADLLHKAGAETVTGNKTFDAYLSETLNTPAAFTGNVNNYALPDAPVARWSSTGAVDVGGLVAPATGRRQVVFNVGAFNITLKHESGSSTAANRFLVPSGDDLVLLPEYGALLWYDLTSARWRVLATWATGSGGGESLSFAVTQVNTFSDFDVVAPDGSGYDLCDTATDNPLAAATGLATGVTGAGFTLITAGRITGMSGLTPGAIYYADPTTPGAYVTPKPTYAEGEVEVELFKAVSATEAVLQIMSGFVTPAAVDMATQAELDAHTAEEGGDGAHGAVSNASPDKLVTRDGAGRAKFVAGAAAGDAIVYGQAAAGALNASATDKLLCRFTAGAGPLEEATLTAAGRALLDDADADTMLATLGAGIAPARTDITGSGTYNWPTGAKLLLIDSYGAGGGGGGGRRGAAGGNRFGGGGGNPGGRVFLWIMVADLVAAGAASLTVTIGAAGSAGAAATADDTSGGAGGNGGNTQVATDTGIMLANAVGGNGGGAGTGTTGTGGAANTGAMFNGAAGGAGTTGAGTAATFSVASPGSGGGGGGLSATDTAAAGGAGGRGGAGLSNAGSLPAGGTAPGGTGTSATANTNATAHIPPHGAGGGASATAGAAGAGGTGERGSGGGGGGASVNGQNSGAGGAGGAGFCRITAY